MYKKIICGVLLFSMMFLCSCGKKPTVDIDDGFTNSLAGSEPVKEVKELNPLTGVPELTKTQTGMRPTAVMINNFPGIEAVQTGVNKADIVYETEVEGGISRMMAVFKDVSLAGQIGCVRSARYAFVDLAAGHDALYVHVGMDPNYCARHFNELKSDHFDLNTGSTAAYGFREPNGKAYEHTMYTSGAKLTEGAAKLKRRTTTEKTGWISFNEYDENAVSPAATQALSVKINFPAASSSFSYNAQTGLYERTKNNAVLKDYKTGDCIAVKNVFVLKTTVTDYSDGVHRNVALKGGSGYYISNGTYEEINWSKGDANSQLSFTRSDGTEFKANPGKSWICIINSSGKVTFTAAPAETSSAQ